MHLLRCENLLESDLSFKFLGARCLAECGDWDECLAILGDGEGEDPMEINEGTRVHICLLKCCQNS